MKPGSHCSCNYTQRQDWNERRRTCFIIRKELGTLSSQKFCCFHHHLHSYNPITENHYENNKRKKNWNVAALTRTQVMIALLTPPRMKACCHDHLAAEHPSSGKTGSQRKEWPRWRSVHHPGMQPGFDIALSDQALTDTWNS